MRLVFWILVAAGAAICGHLLLRHIQLFSEAEAASRDVCSAVFGRGCDAALESPLATQLGLPLAGWGLVFYGVLAALVVMGRAIGPAFERDAQVAATALAAAGAVVSLALAAAMAAGLAPLCPLCLAAHGVNLALVPMLVRMSGRSFAQWPADARAVLSRLTNGEPDAAAEGRWRLLGFFAAALVGVVLYQWVLIEIERHTFASPRGLDREQLLARFEATPRLEAEIGPDDPLLGPEAAPVQIVVFSDFQCAACRRFAQQINSLRDRFGDDIRIAFKHFPLSPTCNSAVTRDLHPRACQAAWAAEAARRQDRFWPVHDALFAAGSRDPRATIQAIAAREGLDMARLDGDLKSAATRAKILADVELGRRWGVDRTPAIFVNGRRAPSPRMRSLTVLIEHQL